MTKSSKPWKNKVVTAKWLSKHWKNKVVTAKWLSKHWKKADENFQTLEIAWICAFALALAVGTVLRVYGAWAFRFTTHPDCGIVALMAKHVATGKPWPVFFYGQSYMGSLEPLLSALFCKIWGVSGLNVNLGTAIFAILCLPVVFLLGRELGGRRTGVLALVLCVIGPRVYFLFQFAPRGGYMLVQFCGLLLLWLCIRLAKSQTAGKRVSGYHFALIGLVAGIGWWSNAMISAALVAGALVIFSGLRGRLLDWRLFAGAVGFVVGSLPFWLWNFTHDWASFRLLADAGGVSLAQGFQLLWAKYVLFISPRNWPAGWRLIFAVFWLGLSFGGILIGVCRSKRRLATLGLGVFLVVTAIMFAGSTYAHIDTLRYLIPFYPVLAILVAGTVGALRGRWFYAGTALLLLVTLTIQFPVLRTVRSRAAHYNLSVSGAENLLNFLDAEDVRAVYADYRYHTFNFVLQEQVVFLDERFVRYLPYARQAELANNVAMYENYGLVNTALNYLGGSGRHTNINSRRIDYGFVPPANGMRLVASNDVKKAYNSAGNDLREVLFDGDMDSRWMCNVSRGQKDFVEVNFVKPQDLCGLRLVTSKPYGKDLAWRIDCRRGPDDKWFKVVPDIPLAEYFWSGPRLYRGGRRLRTEARLQLAGITDLRIYLERKNPHNPRLWAVNEIQFFEPDTAGNTEIEAYEKLRSEVVSRGIKRLYADRWVSNRLYEDLRGKVKVELFELAFPITGISNPSEIVCSAGTALLVLKHDAETTRQTLAKNAIEVAEININPWVMFVLKSAKKVNPRIYWTGYTCFTGHARAFAYDCLRAARSAEKPEALALLQAAIGAYSNIIFAAGDLIERVGDAELKSLAAQRMQPQHEIGAHFKNRIELYGLSIMSPKAVPGETARIKYFWRIPPDLNLNNLMVFAHFKRDDNLFQNDHYLLRGQSAEEIADRKNFEMMVEELEVKIPANITPGAYDLALGLFYKHNNARVPVKSRLPVENKAILLREVWNIAE